LGLRKSALYNKAQIGGAILNETFHPKTIRAIKEERITQRQLLHKLRQRQNSKVISEGLRDISKTQGSTIKKTLKIKIKLPKKESPEKIKQSTPFEKEKKIIKAAHKDRLAHQIMNQVEKGEISLDTAVEQVDTIENLNKSRIKHVIEDQKKVGKKFEEYTHELRLKPVNRKAGQYKEDRCGSCSLAHLYIAICFKCGEVAKCLNCQSPIFQVICEKDIIERTWNLRDPNLAKCNNSPAIKKKK